MPPSSIYLKALRDQRWQIIGFGLTLAAMAALIVFIWPSYRDMLQNFEVPPYFEALLGDLSIATAPGFLSAEFYSWMPVLLMVYAIIQGTGAIAGEEGAGTMDLLLAQPVTRRSVVLQRLAAAATGMAVIVAIGYLGWLVSIPFVDIDVTLWDVFVANVNMLPITMFFFTMALAAGAVAPSRGMAVAVVVGFATLTYFVQTIAATVEPLERLQYVSPFYFYGSGLPLVEGLNWPHVALLLVSSAVFALVAVRAFDRRDVSAGGASDLSLLEIVRRALPA